MQQPSSTAYQYGASTDPTALPGGSIQGKPPSQYNSMEEKQSQVNGDNGLASHYSKPTGNYQNLPSQYSSGQAGTYTSNPISNDKYMSSFSSTTGSSTLSSVPLNSLYQQTSAFTSVSSSYNQNNGVSSADVVGSTGNSDALPLQIGTPRYSKSKSIYVTWNCY